MYVNVIRRAAVVAAAVSGLLLAAAGAASAGVHAGPPTTDGMAGYFATGLGHIYYQTQATFDLNPQAQAIGTTTSLADPKGAIGSQLCNNGSGNAAEEGVVYNGGGTFTLAYALGTLPANAGDPCVGGGILTNGTAVHPLLTHLGVGDSVTVQITEYRAGILFAATDNSTTQSFTRWVAFRSCHWVMGHHYWRNHRRHWARGHYVCKGHHPFFNEVGAGVMQNLTNLGGPATNDLVDFWGVTADGLQALGTWNAESVTSSGTGIKPWLVGPAASLSHGPNGGSEVCTPDPATSKLVPGGAVIPLASPAGEQFSICSATATGA